ncbi:glycosyltransferase family 9 protein [Nitrospira sp. BLG_2]|uniref:glycosyltransferase family 9 protein n=1 Tax=Nitrospira sp. BLG_2 TaxID=3397507 RepID=UPI003B990F83
MVIAVDRSRADLWRRSRRILCVRLDALGDVIMTGPALRALKQSFPDRHITLLTSASGVHAGRLMPCVDDIWSYEAPWMKGYRAGESAAADHALISRLRAGAFDAAVLFTVYSQNPLPAAMMCWLADIPLRVAHCRENPYHLLTDWIPEPEPESYIRHEVRRQLDLVRHIGAEAANERLFLQIPGAAFDHLDEILGPLRTKVDEAVVIHPGATAASRRYPAEQFAVAADRLAHTWEGPIIFTGVESERPLVESIRARVAAPTHSLAGRLQLPELAALLARARVLISNNTGAVHVAAAVGTPVVDLYALTNPQHTPWQVPRRVLFHDVPCKFCYKSTCPQDHHDCLRLVTPDEIVDAAAELLGLRPTPLSEEGLHLVHTRS